ncbi:Probable LRR receptor-like serine/threonine-protein kinase At1g74360 [Linum perenne]
MSYYAKDPRAAAESLTSLLDKAEDGPRVIGIDLADDNISSELYGNFSSLTALEFLDLSRNSLLGEVNFTGLRSLEVIDLAKNRFSGGIQFDSPGMCMNLVVANLSENFFTGRVDHSFVGCSKLQYLDLSSNHFVGGLWSGFSKLKEFSASENGFNELHESDFDENCSLLSLDIAENRFTGTLPGNVSNCKNLTILNAGGNHFSGLIPSQIGTISGLGSLLLGNNSFSSDIPETLLNLKNLTLVDLSRNSFGGGLHSSGLLSLTNLVGDQQIEQLPIPMLDDETRPSEIRACRRG